MAFLELWRAHPGNNGSARGWHPEVPGEEGRGVDAAMALSQALGQVKLLPQLLADARPTAAGVASLLDRAGVKDFGPRQVVTARNVSAFLQAVFGQTGVIFAAGGGDHIDVWNGYRSASLGLAQWTGRVDGTASLGGTNEIWFWPLA